MISSSQSRPPFKVMFSVFVRVWEKIFMKSSLRSHPLFKVIRTIVNSIGIRTIRSSDQFILMDMENHRCFKPQTEVAPKTKC